MPRASATPSATAPWGWAFSGAVCGLLLVLLWQAPGQWLTSALQQATQGRLQFHQTRGSLWQGSAQVSLAGGFGSQDAALLPGRLSWRLHLSGLSLQADLLADCCMQQPWRLSLSPGWGSLHLSLADNRAQWPAAVLAGLGTPWNTLQAQGQLGLSSQALEAEWSAGRLRLSGRAPKRECAYWE